MNFPLWVWATVAAIMIAIAFFHGHYVTITYPLIKPDECGFFINPHSPLPLTAR
jgi:hypothetical protein